MRRDIDACLTLADKALREERRVGYVGMCKTAGASEGNKKRVCLKSMEREIVERE